MDFFWGFANPGVHIHGLFLEGASWEEGKGDDEGYVSDSKMKDPASPSLIHCRYANMVIVSPPKP